MCGSFLRWILEFQVFEKGENGVCTDLKIVKLTEVSVYSGLDLNIWISVMTKQKDIKKIPFTLFHVLKQYIFSILWCKGKIFIECLKTVIVNSKRSMFYCNHNYLLLVCLCLVVYQLFMDYLMPKLASFVNVWL